VIHPPGWRSSHSVRLIGLDPLAYRGISDRMNHPGRVRVTGIWRGETISVDDQGSVAYPARRYYEFGPPCAAPVGGWDPVADLDRLPELQSVAGERAIVRDQWRSTSGGRSCSRCRSDVDLVERFSASLTRPLCVSSRVGTAPTKCATLKLRSLPASGVAVRALGGGGLIKTVSRTPSPNSCG